MTNKRAVPGPADGQRAGTRGDPDDFTAGPLDEQFGRLARRVYGGVRAGAVDCEAAFDLAALLMEVGPPEPILEELAELSLAGTDQERIADVARQVLATRFEPGFDLEPGRLTALEEALKAVEVDLRATGVPGPVRLVVPAWSNLGYVFVEFRDGGFGSTSGIAPVNGSDPIRALLAVADDAQDSVMETLWEPWPVCPAHHLGVHAREYAGAAVWWCEAAGGHNVAGIGQWNR